MKRYRIKIKENTNYLEASNPFAGCFFFTVHAHLGIQLQMIIWSKQNRTTWLIQLVLQILSNAKVILQHNYKASVRGSIFHGSQQVQNGI
jgi:hypothetical protein